MVIYSNFPPRLRRFSWVAICLTLLCVPRLPANPFHILELNPILFQQQKLAFDKTQSLGILQEYLFKEMQTNPGAVGLMLDNLISYEDSVGDKDSHVQTSSLEFQALHGGPKQLNDDDRLVIRGFYLASHLERYLDQEALLQDYVNSASQKNRNPWLKIIVGVLYHEAQGKKVELKIPGGSLESLLGKASGQTEADAPFHFALGNFYLNRLKGGNPYRRLRLVTMEFERGRTRDPRNRNFFTEIAARYIEIHEEFQAKNIPEPFEFEELVYRRIILLDPRNAWAHNNLAYLYCQGNVEVREALRESRIANHLIPDNPYLMDTLGWALYKNKMYEESLKIFKKILEMDDGIPDVHFHLATVYYDLKKVSISIEHFKRCIELDPENSLAKNNLAYLYSEQGTHLDEGLKLVQTALKKSPKNSAYLDTLGWLYFQKGDYKAALEPLKKAVEIAPDSAESQYHLGQIYLKMNQVDASVEHLQKSMEFRPKNKKSKDPKQSYLILLNSIQKAKDQYLKLPGVLKTKESLKVFYDQLIYLSQSMGDISLLQKFAKEFDQLEDKTSEDKTSSLSEPPSPASKKDEAEQPTSEPNSIQEFFPRKTDFYLGLKHDSLVFILDRILKSGVLDQNINIKRFAPLLRQRLPKQFSLFMGKPGNDRRTQIYGVVELQSGQNQFITDQISALSSDSLISSVFQGGIKLEPLMNGVYQVQGPKFALFLAIKGRFLIVSNSLPALNKAPYEKASSLLANEALKSTLETPKLPRLDAVFYCGNPPQFGSFIEPSYSDYFPEEWQDSLEILNKVENYVSVVHLSDEGFEEHEILSLKDAKDLDPIMKFLESKSQSMKKALKTTGGIHLESNVTVKDQSIAIHTRILDVDGLIQYFLRYFQKHGKELINNKNKGASHDR
jgi:tetratricopeptide (TPR) repeat protein